MVSAERRTRRAAVVAATEAGQARPAVLRDLALGPLCCTQKRQPELLAPHQTQGSSSPGAPPLGQMHDLRPSSPYRWPVSLPSQCWGLESPMLRGACQHWSTAFEERALGGQTRERAEARNVPMAQIRQQPPPPDGATLPSPHLHLA